MDGKQIYHMLYAEYKALVKKNTEGMEFGYVTPDQAQEDTRTQAEKMRDIVRNAEILGFRKAMKIVGSALKKEGSVA